MWYAYAVILDSRSDTRRCQKKHRSSQVVRAVHYGELRRVAVALLKLLLRSCEIWDTVDISMTGVDASRTAIHNGCIMYYSILPY
jgi:hypothetical protein